MNGGVALIIGMASLTIASGITEKILNSAGKIEASQMMDIACKSLLALTSITAFIKFIQALKSLG